MRSRSAPPRRLCAIACAMLVCGVAPLKEARAGAGDASGAAERGVLSPRPVHLRLLPGSTTTRIASAAIHFAHGKQDDVLALTPLAEARRWDAELEAECLQFVYAPPRLEPHMMYWGPHVGQAMWSLYRAIDWTHIHHEQTYDVLSDPGIPWSEKKESTDRAVHYYLTKNALARSPAPLDVTMRRAGVMMKPYATVFRNRYPRSNDFFFAAHWWHQVIYEAMMIAGDDVHRAVPLKYA